MSIPDPQCLRCAPGAICVHGEQSPEPEMFERDRLRAQLAGALERAAHLESERDLLTAKLVEVASELGATRAARDGAINEAAAAKRDRDMRQAAHARLLDEVAGHLGLGSGLAIAEGSAVVRDAGEMLAARTVIDIAARQLAHLHRSDIAETKIGLYDDARALLRARGAD